MDDYKHFPRIPRRREQIGIEVVKAVIFFCMFIALFIYASNDDHQVQVQISEEILKEDMARGMRKQVERDEKAAAYLFKK